MNHELRIKKIRKKLKLIPKRPGVYFLKDRKGKVIYIGKAGNLRNRVRSYFQPYSGSSGLRTNLYSDIADIAWQETNSEIEALILESQLIKKQKPKYNVMLRDDKNYFFVGITKEELPRIFITHQPEKFKIQKAKGKIIIQNSRFKIKYIGPFTDGQALKRALKILRGIFPYYTGKHPKARKCLYCHIDLCPGPNPNKNDYRKNITHLKEILAGRKVSLTRQLETAMKVASRNKKFERAATIRDQWKALKNIFEHNVILSRTERTDGEAVRESQNYKEALQRYLGIPSQRDGQFRIEGYDISNIQGKYATGSMVTFIDGKPAKKWYRKFRIKTVWGANDIAMIHEVLKRRLRHPEWPIPDLFLIDGGRAQLNAAQNEISKHRNIEISRVPVAALAKRNEEIYVPHHAKPITLARNTPLLHLFMRVRDEAHRFAITYHQRLRNPFL